MVVKPLIAWSLLYKSLISDWCYHNKQRSLPDWVREQGNQQKPEVVQRRNLHANQAFHETHHGVTPPQIHLGGGRSNYPNPNFQAAFHIICQFWLLSLLACLTESLNYLDVGFCFFFFPKKTIGKCHVLPDLTCTLAISLQLNRVQAVGDRTVPVIYPISS